MRGVMKMVQQRARVMSCRRVAKSLQAVVAHGMPFSFTLLLVLKLHYAVVSFSWWIVFIPIWLFHVVFARIRFSIPAPSIPRDRYLHSITFHGFCLPLIMSKGSDLQHALLIYNTFSPDVVKKIPKVGLVEKIRRLQASFGEQTEIRKSSQEEYEKLQNEKILCQVCFEEQKNTVRVGITSFADFVVGGVKGAPSAASILNDDAYV